MVKQLIQMPRTCVAVGLGYIYLLITTQEVMRAELVSYESRTTAMPGADDPGKRVCFASPRVAPATCASVIPLALCAD